MKKLAVSFSLLGFAFADVCERDFRKDLPFAPSDLKVLSKRPVSKGLCEVLVQDRGAIIPLYIGEDFTMVGSLFREGKEITQESRRQARQSLIKDRISEVKSVVVASTGIAKGDRYFFYFVDPNCRYCEASKRKTFDLAKKYGYDVYLVMVPFLGPDSRSKVSRFVCSKGSVKNYLEGEYKGNVCADGDAYAEKVIEVAQALGVAGVPFYLFPDGAFIEGANLGELEKRLSQ